MGMGQISAPTPNLTRKARGLNARGARPTQETKTSLSSTAVQIYQWLSKRLLGTIFRIVQIMDSTSQVSVALHWWARASIKSLLSNSCLNKRWNMRKEMKTWTKRQSISLIRLQTPHKAACPTAVKQCEVLTIQLCLALRKRLGCRFSRYKGNQFKIKLASQSHLANRIVSNGIQTRSYKWIPRRCNKLNQVVQCKTST